MPSAVSASSVTMSLPAGDCACTQAPEMASMWRATIAACIGSACTTKLAMCNSSATRSAPRRTGHQLVHPDGETIARHEDHREHRCHHDGEKQEAAQLLRLGEGLFFCHE